MIEPSPEREQDRTVRTEPYGGLHFEGTGETAWGVKFVLVAARSADPHGRIILDVEWVPTPGGEAHTAMDCFTRLAPNVEGAQGIVYDTALRGVHHQAVLHDLGLIPINRVTAAKAAVKSPRRKGGRRAPKSTYLEDKMIETPNGTETISPPALVGREENRVDQVRRARVGTDFADSGTADGHSLQRARSSTSGRQSPRTARAQ